MLIPQAPPQLTVLCLLPKKDCSNAKCSHHQCLVRSWSRLLVAPRLAGVWGQGMPGWGFISHQSPTALMVLAAGWQSHHS